ncbi:unnamed protein product [Lasius platythorax]|uniref:Uncharacterized protein n=1 Tax=Lasius platythorax TaxID=488582 RepID=A0AAV2NLL3_9HYME
MEGHSFRACTQPSRCVICEAEGRKNDHRLDSVSCKVDKKPRKFGFSAVTPGKRTGDNTNTGSNAQNPTV